MDRARIFLYAVFLLGASNPLGNVLFAFETQGRTLPLKHRTVSQLEHRLAVINNRLNGLAQYSLRSGVGAIGYRSQIHDDANHREWFKIEFEREYSINQVVLVPALLRDSVSGYRAEGFPVRFRIVVGTGTNEEGTVVAEFNAEEGIAPHVISFKDTQASWVLFEADILSSRQFDGKYLLQLAEILVFSDRENVAIGQRFKTSSNDPTGSPAWDARFAVDGFMPYLMNGAGGEESLAFVGKVGIEDEPSLTIDLGAIYPVSQVNLHLVDQSDTVPQTFSGDFGIPKILRIEGAKQADFLEARTLVEFQSSSIYDIGPIVFRRFPITDCRYVRLTAIKPFVVLTQEPLPGRIGFAEVEFIAEGKNVALGKKIQTSIAADVSRTIVALTDGNNYFGRILPLRNWLAQLAERHDLETERPLVEAELSRRYQRQRAYLVSLIWLAVVLSVFALTAVLLGRSMRTRAVKRTRERIAADLHDELGANFHAIGLLSDIAQANSDSAEKLKPLLQRIRDLTDRTGKAANYCANLLESEGLFGDLEQDMRRTSARLMADLDHEFTFQGHDVLRQLKPGKRIGLFLFYKESLTNIIRHSGATKVTTHLSADAGEILLKITDNGYGLPINSSVVIPPSLKRRARLLGAHVNATHPETGGTQIELRLRPGRPWNLRLLSRNQV